MDKTELRLKCLEIASVRASDPNDILARATAFEKYVVGPVEDVNHKIPEIKRLDPSKKSDNSKILP